MMKAIEISREINVSLEVAYRVAAELERYPEFVPGVTRVSVLSGDCDRQIVEIEGEIGPIKSTSRSFVTLDRNRSIRILQMEGLFRSAECEWTFEPTEAGVKITFKAYAEMGHGFLFKLLVKLLSHSIHDISNAFIRRMETIERGDL